MKFCSILESSSWINTWLLNTGATCHLAFIKYFFEYFNDNVDGRVSFADKSILKPKGIGTIKLKLPRFLDLILQNVLYLLEFERNLLSLLHI